MIDASYPTVDLLRIPAHRLMNFIYAWCMERVPPDKIEEWQFQLEAPLPGEERKTEISEAQWEDEGQGFMAFMGQVTGGGG